MARTLKQIREQNARRQVNLTVRNKEKGLQKVCVWVASEDKAKAVRELADNPSTQQADKL